MKDNEMPLLEDNEYKEYTSPRKLTLVGRRALSVQVKENKAI